ncbi:MAG TPA: hypothetical protein VLJ21_05000, partial [Candidatus Binatia bacterium]|nr:hypothetical protein [Candidatus Binatia bacterium]
VVFLGKGQLKIGSAEVAYGYDLDMKDGALDRSSIGMPLGVGNRVVSIDPKQSIALNTLAAPCTPSDVPKKIAILPASQDASELAIQLLRQDLTRFTPQTSQIAGLLDTTNEQVRLQRKQVMDAADAVIFVARSASAKQSLAYFNARGAGLACRLLNGIVPLQNPRLPATFSAASIPLIKQNLPANHPAQELPDNKPALFLVISTDQNAIEVAKNANHALT